MVTQDHNDLLLLEGEWLVPELHCEKHIIARIEVGIGERVEVVNRTRTDSRPVMTVEEGETLAN